MRVNDFEMYFRAITPIEAQEVLLDLTVADFPMMKKGQREKIHSQLKKTARSIDAKREPMTTEKLAAIIGSVGNLGNGRK